MPRPSPSSLALPKFEKEEKALDLRLRLKGRAALDLLEYQRAYEADHGEPIDPDMLAQHIIATFLERDRGFQVRRKTSQSEG